MSQQQSSANFIKTILITGFIAGTLDMTAATLASQAPLVRVCQYIASAVFGAEAFSGGTSMTLAGLLFHYIIAYSWTILFFLIYPKVNVISKHPVITGLLYGLAVWTVMNLVIVPLTLIPGRPFALRSAVINAVILMFAIGLPISLLAHRYYSKNAIA